jgi:polyisoprenoid-binding protein YceI
MQLLFLLFSLAFVSDPILAKTIGKASFHASGKGFALDVNGEGAMVDGDIIRKGKSIAGSFTVTLADFKTGIDKRDQHLRETLEVTKYPIAKLTLDETALGSPLITGNLELHGVTRKVSWAAEFKGNTVIVHGLVSLSEFGIKPPEYKFVKIEDGVELVIEISI